MESLADEEGEDPLKNSEDSDDLEFLDSGNITVSLLSIDDSYESEEDEYLERLLQHVKRAPHSPEFRQGVPPLRPIVESIV